MDLSLYFNVTYLNVQLVQGDMETLNETSVAGTISAVKDKKIRGYFIDTKQSVVEFQFVNI